MFVVLVPPTYAKAGSPGLHDYQLEEAARRASRFSRHQSQWPVAAVFLLCIKTLDESPHDKYQGSSASSGDIRHFLIPLQTVAHMYHCIYPSLVLVSAQLPSNCIPMSLESSLT